MKKKILIIALIVVIICILGFIVLNSSSNEEYKLNETILLKKHKTVSIKDTDLKLYLASVGDSRCKKGWQCIWQGEIEYYIRINNDTVSLGTVRQKEVEYGNYKLILNEDNNSTKYVRFRIVKN